MNQTPNFQSNIEQQPENFQQEVPVQTQPPVKKSMSPVLIGALVLGFALIGVGGYWLGAQSVENEVGSVANTGETPAVEVTDEPSAETNQPSLFTPISLTSILDASCVRMENPGYGSIQIEDLPVTIDEGTRNKYQLRESIQCMPKHIPSTQPGYENLAAVEYFVEAQQKNLNENAPAQSLYIFTDQSKWGGQDNLFASASELLTIALNQTQYSMNIKDPGPYGISDLGIWVDLIGDKNHAVSSLTIRSISSQVIDNPETDALVKEYSSGTAFPKNNLDQTLGAEPDYVVADKEGFIRAFVELVETPGTATHNTLVDMSKSIDQDLAGVEFK